MYSLEVATWVHGTSGYGGTTAMQRWTESRYICLAFSEAQIARERRKTFSFPAVSNNGQRDVLLSNNLMENCNGQLKHWLSKMTGGREWGDIALKG